MEKTELDKILNNHKKWLDGEGKECANLHHANLLSVDLQRFDLRYVNLLSANLRGADLQHADLQHADFLDADLQYADVRGANFDFSVFPLWCGSFDMIVDERLIRQLAYHILKLDYRGNDKDIKKLLKNDTLIKVANASHIMEEK